jgi:hypothetical protein
MHALHHAPGASRAHYRALLEKLCATHRSIERLSLRIAQHAHAIITLYAAQPHIIVNERYYIASNGHAFECNHLKALPTEQLIALTVDHYDVSDHGLNQSLYQWIQHIPAGLLSAYTLHWHDATHINLYPKHCPRYTLACTDTTPLSQQLLDSSLVCLQKKEVDSPIKVSLHADLRFLHQIIITTHKTQSGPKAGITAG